jgi:hypothetical protein
MSARRPQPPRPSAPEPDIPEDEEVDFDEEEGFDEGPDLMDVLGGFLATEDGETIATSLAAMKDALITQNKIMVKMLSALMAKQTCTCACCCQKKDEATEAA